MWQAIDTGLSGSTTIPLTRTVLHHMRPTGGHPAGKDSTFWKIVDPNTLAGKTPTDHYLGNTRLKEVNWNPSLASIP